MGRLGKLNRLASLPGDDVIVDLVRTTIAQVDAGGSLRENRAAKPVLAMPDDLQAAFGAAPATAAGFAALSPTSRREYIEWIIEGKAAATRAKRVATTVEWPAEGTRSNWKYEAC